MPGFIVATWRASSEPIDPPAPVIRTRLPRIISIDAASWIGAPTRPRMLSAETFIAFSLLLAPHTSRARLSGGTVWRLRQASRTAGGALRRRGCGRMDRWRRRCLPVVAPALTHGADPCMTASMTDLHHLLGPLGSGHDPDALHRAIVEMAMIGGVGIADGNTLTAPGAAPLDVASSQCRAELVRVLERIADADAGSTRRCTTPTDGAPSPRRGAPCAGVSQTSSSSRNCPPSPSPPWCSPPGVAAQIPPPRTSLRGAVHRRRGPGPREINPAVATAWRRLHPHQPPRRRDTAHNGNRRPVRTLRRWRVGRVRRTPPAR